LANARPTSHKYPRLRLEELVSQVPAAVQPYDLATALAVLSLIAGDQDDPDAASLASVRHGRGELAGARALVERFADPGVLPALLEQTEGVLGSRPRWRVQVDAPLT
jgi:hypothetical protein